MISVIMPVFNGEKFVEKSIKSVLSQTHEDFELIIVNDGSSDASAGVIKKFSDSRIKYFHKRNGGAASARNLGMDQAKGEFLCFIDCDDTYKPEKLEIQLEEFSLNPDIDCVFCDCDVIDEDDNFLSVLKSQYYHPEKSNLLATLLYRQVIPVPPVIMPRRRLIEKGIRYNEKLTHAEDYLFIINLASEGKIKYIESSLYNHRRHKNNLTNSHGKQLQGEKATIIEIGESRILEIVEQSSFTADYKNFLLANIYLKIDAVDKAIKHAEKITEKNFSYVFLNGVTAFLSGNIPKARELFFDCVKIGHKAEAYNNLGVCRLINNEIGSAGSDFSKALDLQSDYMDAAYNFNYMDPVGYRFTKRELRETLMIYGCNQGVATMAKKEDKRGRYGRIDGFPE